MTATDAHPAEGGVTLEEILAYAAGRRTAVPFALLHRPDTAADALDLLSGPVTEAGSLEEIALPDGPGEQQTLVMVPFRMAAAHGLDCHDDRAPLVVMPVRERATVPLDEALRRIPDAATEVREGRFDVDDEAYEDIVRRVVDEQIGTGEGCNFVISRSFTGTITAYSLANALALFRRLLEQEHGAYWTFLVHTGRHTFVGATPERHVTLADGVATMNPISGTYRYPETGPTVPGLVDFLSDGKETDELYMVLDEELKMMGAVCDRGVRALGPYLKEMAHLAHTEYFITGDTALGAVEVIRRTMFAPTVVGSPLVNAFRVIKGYERSGRGHYSGIAALVGRDGAGRDTLDSAIMIRTAQIAATGDLRIGVGATLVRHSQPAAEVAETRAKAGGLLAGMGYGRASAVRRAPGAPAPSLGGHEEISRALEGRNATLSTFWFNGEEGRAAVRRDVLAGRRLLVVDAEDRFTAMLGHQLRALGLDIEIRSHQDPFDTAGWDCVLVGPGPGDPLDVDDARIGRLHTIVSRLRAGDTPFLAVCLGHQVLSSQLGLDLMRRESPNQGVQREIDLFGARERVGLYNTFVAVSGSDSFVGPGMPGKIEVSRDSATGEVYGMRGHRFRSWQFHPESVLTQHGPRLLGETLTALLGAG